MNIIDRIKKLFPVTRPAARQSMGKFEPNSWIEWMDVNRIAMAITSARGGNTTPLFALYRDIIQTDSHIQGELAKRKLAVLGDIYRILPWDKTIEADKMAAVEVEKAIYSMSGWRSAISHLLDSTLLPVAVIEKIYEADGDKFRLAKLQPVPAHLLDYSTGSLMITSTDEEGKPLKDLIEPDPVRYIIHRGHLLSTPDQLGGPMRSLIFWWLCSSMSQDWWVRFLEHFGTPFMVAKYDKANPEDRAILQSAISQAARLMGVAISKDAEIALTQAAAGTPDAYERFIDHAESRISKLIVGQTLSAQAAPTGLGSGVSDMQTEVRDDIRKLDSQMLGETLRDQLFEQFCRINRMPGRPPTIAWGSESPADQKATADLLAVLRTANLEPDDSAMEVLSEKVGFGLRRAPIVQQPFTPPGPPQI